MVLQANTNNCPPNENALPSKHESLATRDFRASFHAVASRGRTRNNGSKSTRYAVEQAKRRTIFKSPSNIIRLSFSILDSHPPTPTMDVETKDGSTPLRVRTVPIQFPLYLGRPEYAEVPKTSIENIDPELANADVSYIRDTLMAGALGPSMYQVLRKYSARDKDLLTKGSLPREIAVIIEEMTLVLPTHMMAIHGPPPKNTQESRTKVTLFPIHSLILAAHCAKLPAFPPMEMPDPKINATSREIVLPVRPLFLHSPKTFPILVEYLYLRRTETLLRHLLPIMLSPAFIEQTDKHEPLARILGTKFSVQGLLQQLTIIHGLWQNVCALGVYDDELWTVLDFSWKLSLMSLAISTGKPEALTAIKAAETALANEQAAAAEVNSEDRQRAAMSA